MDWHQLWEIVSAPDNIPIVALVPLLVFYMYLFIKQARANDDLITELEANPQLAKTHHRKTWPFRPGWQKEIHVWPFLLRVEFLAAIIVTIILMVWSITLSAPLEEPSNPNLTMNPAKAPWYFLGLQEMLVYYDPWMAGVVLPTMIIVGLIAIPYIDFNQKGNGYYTFTQRSFSVTTFLFGFVVLWVTLIVLGTFLRGPNWNFFGPFEAWNVHKAVPLNNVNLSEYFWRDFLGFSMESLSGPMWPLRELPGILLVLAYLLVTPPLLAKTLFRPFFVRMGFIRFFVLVTLIQFMAALPIKMVLRWTINLKYIVAIPELFFNI